MTIRLALLSYWHVHAMDYEREATANPETSISVVWDEIPERGAGHAERIGAHFEPSLEAVLADPNIDGVVVTTATSEHCRVIVAAAQAGKHIFTEKVIAATTSDAEAVLSAVQDAGVTMMVCVPRLSNGYVRALKSMLERVELGPVSYFRMRVGHNGAVRTDSDPEGWLPAHFYDPATAEGGALIDFGAHPLYVSRHLLGMPENVSATYSYVTGRAVEDQAVVSLRYQNGAIAVAEVSFLDQPGSYELEIHGEKGIVRIGMPDMVLRIRRAKANRREPSAWEDVPVPEDLNSPFDQWVGHIVNGTNDPENLAISLDLTRLAEASNQSAQAGRTVTVG